MKKSQIITFVCIVMAILFLTHLVIYEVVRTVFDFSPPQILTLRIIMLMLWLSFITAQLIAVKYNNFFSRIYYQLACSWLAFLMYLFLASIVYGIISGIILLLHLNIPLRPLGAVLLGIAAITVVYGLIHAWQIKIKTIHVTLSTLPPNWKTKKLVWISDLHLGHIRTKKFAAQVARMVNDLRPEIIFIGGDLYDGVSVDEKDIISPLKNLKPIRETYFITGNHDGFSDSATSRDLGAIESTGIKVLRDQLVDRDGLQIVGVDYKHTTDRKTYAEILKNLNIDQSKPSILLKHVPSDVDIAAGAGISLQLSGHTHRAQAWPLSYIPGLIFKHFDYGLKKFDQMQEFTSSGVGTWGPPIRVGTDCEIVEIILN